MMDSAKIGKVIKDLRTEKGLTQRALAERLGISEQAVSKWERGGGCPDITLLTELSEALGVELTGLLSGELTAVPFVTGNMKKTRYFVCPTCGNIVASTGTATLSCCNRTLVNLEPKKPDTDHAVNVELIEDEWCVTSSHPMEKSHYFSFMGFATGERLQLIKLYPEWEMQVRIPMRQHGTLLWYCTQHGLFACNV